MLEIGYMRGADLWHLANALYIAPKRDVHFLTLDLRQQSVARALRFGP